MQKKQRFRKRVIAWMTALMLAAQPVVGAVMYPAVTAEAAETAEERVPIQSIQRYNEGDPDSVLEKEGVYSFVMPRMNSDALGEGNNYQKYLNSYKILFFKDGEWVDITEILGENRNNESAVKSASGGAWCTVKWEDSEWSGWGMVLKLDEELGNLNTIRFQSVDYDNTYLDYKLVDVDSITSLSFVDADGDDKLEVGAGAGIAVNFDYIRINEDKLIGAGQYGQTNFVWRAIANGEEKTLEEMYGEWFGHWGWDDAPINGGYYFNPIKESVTFRVYLRDREDIYADYEVTVVIGPKGPEYDPSKDRDSSQNVKDPGTNKEGYKLVWQDEFDGNYGSDKVDVETGLNLDKWAYQLGDGKVEADNTGWGNWERQSYSDRVDNIQVKDGLLRITAKYEDEEYYSAYPGVESAYAYSSARIVTRGQKDGTNPLFTTTYGYVEARMALPETAGAWPAFWMLPQSTELYGEWPVSGEIDIMETCGFRTDEACATLHWGSPEHMYLGSDYQKLSSDMKYFHTYAVDWEPGKITFIYDGKPVYTQTNWESKIPGTSDSLAFDAPFDQPYYILLNLAVDNGLFGGSDNMASFQDNINMYVDYVRVYQKDGGYNTEDISRTMLNSKDDWKTKTGNQIADIKKENLETAADGNMNAMEEDETMVADKWYLAYTEGGAASIDAVENDGTQWAKIQVTTPGNQNYSAQLIGHYNAQPGYLYKISFDAYAEGGLVGQTATCDSKEWLSWGTYGATSFELENTPAHYSFLIDQQAAFENCRVEVNLGGMGIGTAYIGNVRVEIVDPAELGKDRVRNSKALASGEVLYNGTFDQGNNRTGFWTAAEGTTFTVPSYTEENLNNDIAIKDVAAGITKYYAHRAQVKADAGKNPGIYQSGFALPMKQGEKDKKAGYTLTFDMYSEKAATVNVALHAADEKGGLGNLLLDSNTMNCPEKKLTKYAWTFETLRDLQNAAIALTFGEGADVQIDNVSLRPANDVKIDSSATSMERDKTDYGEITYVLSNSNAVNADANPDVYVRGTGTITLAAPVLDGVKFAGWSLDKAAQYKEDYVTEVSTDAASITLYANWGDEITDSSNKIETPAITTPLTGAEYVVGQPANSLSIRALLHHLTGELSYQWYSGASDEREKMEPIKDDATESTYTPDTSKAGVTYYYCKVTNTDETADDGPTVSVDSDVAAITVTVEEPRITTHPIGREYNVGAVAVPLSVDAHLQYSEDKKLSYQWYSGASEDPEKMKPIKDATESTYTPDTSKAGVTYYYCEIMNRDETAADEKTKSVKSDVAAITVKVEIPTITTHPTGAEYVAGAVANPLSVDAVLRYSDGELSYQWYIGASEDPEKMVPIKGAIESTYTPDTSKAGVTYYYCEVTNTDDTPTGDETAWARSSTATITVNARITMSIAKTSILQNETTQCTVSGGQNVTYASSNPAVATVDAKGVVTGKSAGTVTIIATSSSDNRASVVVTVIKPTVKWNVTYKTVPLQLKNKKKANKTTALQPTGLQDGDSILSYQSSKTKIATVKKNSKGRLTITPKKTGKTKITVTTKYGATAVFTLKVQKNAVKVSKITVDNVKNKKLTLKKGKTFTLQTTKKYITALDKVKFSTDKKSVASVNSKGKIKAKKKGKAKITVECGKKKTVVTVTVEK